MTDHPRVFDPRRGADNPYEYYLVGSAASRGELHGLPSAFEALRRGLINSEELESAEKELKLWLERDRNRFREEQKK